MVKSYGTQYGIGNYADHISIGSDGTAHVSDPTWKKAILGLRQDPQISAEMAGELDKENSASLQANVGGKIGSTELYLAHFLGASGASDFLNTMRANPNAKAADILPEAAASNSSVFYGADGEPRSVAQIYQHFARKFDATPTPAPTTLVASAAPAQSTSIPASQKSTTSYAAAPYIVADAAAARSAYATAIMGNAKPDLSSLFATMVLAQMKMDDTLSAPSPGINAYSKKDAISALGVVA